MKNKLNASIIILIAICVASCNQTNNNKHIPETRTTKSENLPVFLIYGELAPLGYLEETDSIVAKKFGFNIKRVAGCDVTNRLMDSVKKINTESNTIMKLKHGNNWKQKFEKQSRLKMAIPEI